MEKTYNFDNNIYSEDIVKKAIIDFKDISEIIIDNNNLIISWKNELEIDEIFNEFFNYVIWIYNEN